MFRCGKKKVVLTLECYRCFVSICSPTGKAHNPSSPTGVPQEVWFHEDCVTWCHGVYLAASKVHGLDEAIAVAKQTVSCPRYKSVNDQGKNDI